MVEIERLAELLEALSTKETSLEDDRAEIISFFGQASVRSIDFEAAVAALVSCGSQAVPVQALGETQACVVSLSEDVDGCALGLVGFSRFDTAGAAWASEEPLWFSGPCPAISPQLGGVFQAVDDDGGLGWAVVLAVAIALAKAARPSLFARWPIDRPPVLAVGFVDGDLYRIGYGAIAA